MENTKKVLIADSSEEFSAILSEAISKEDDLEVVGRTGDGQEAIRLAEELGPDILVMDLVLGRVDGLDVLDGVAKLPCAPWCSRALPGAASRTRWPPGVGTTTWQSPAACPR